MNPLMAALRYTASPAMGGNGSTSASQRVYEDLRHKIINFVLPPDTVLSRTNIAREYEVSLTPVREALQQLESEGLVKIYPQSKTLVTRLVLHELHEAHLLRVAVEVEVVRRLATSITPEILSRLETIVSMQNTLAGNSEERASFLELDEIFHRTMMAAIGHESLHDLLRSRSGHFNRLRQLHLPDAGKSENILKDHHAIIAALEACDPDLAQKAMRKHLSQTITRVDELRRQHPDYFI